MHEETNLQHPGGATTSLWHATAEVPRYSPLGQDLTTDVCVVGAGIAGMTTAYMLTRAGRRVVVIDDGPIGGGETGRTTAHLTAAMDDRIYRLEHVHGEEGARRIVESHMAAVNRIEAIVQMEKIDCDFRRVDGYLFNPPGDEREDLDREYDAAKRAGFADIHKVERAPIASFDTGPALRFPQQAQFHILKYISGLAQAIVRDGGAIYTGSHVEGIEGGVPCRVKTSDGKTVRADAVCVCTNASISDYVQTHAKQAPYRTYVVALRIPRGTVDPALYWDTLDPYHYVRVQALDGAQAPTKGDVLDDALIVGGEDHRTGHAEDGEARWRRLEAWARERWPQARELMHKWSGQVFEPNDYAAFIGRNPDGAENVYMASGDSGQGMTHGTIAGMLLTDLITGKENPWETVYDPKRISLRAGPAMEFAKHNVEVVADYVKDWLGPGEGNADQVPRGEGRVLRRGMHRVAAYRDDSGTLHECSAVCTHLRCIVSWNPNEKSWDCPCHGSRFDPYGKVINGPAISDLEKL